MKNELDEQEYIITMFLTKLLMFIIKNIETHKI